MAGGPILAGGLRRDGGPAPREWVISVLRSLTGDPAVSLRVWEEGPVAWGVTGTGVEVWEAPASEPVGCVIGRLYERGASSGRLVGSRLRQAVGSAYRQEDVTFLKRFGGAFACVLWDPRWKRLLCGCDPLGKVALYAWMGPRVLVFSSTLAVFRSLPEIVLEIHEEKVIDFLLHMWLTGIEETYYRGIRRLRPGHVWVLQDGDLREVAYVPVPPVVPEAPPARPMAEVIADLREAVTRAVRRSVDDPTAVGVSVSGGLDSSVLAVVTRASFDFETLPRLPTFSIAFDAVPQSDERAYWEPLVCQPGFDPQVLVGDRVRLADSIDFLIDSQEEPFRGPNLWMDAAIARQAATLGIRQVLHGFDGNTVIPHGYLNLAGYARNGHWKALLRELVTSSRRRERRIIQEFRRWVLYPNIPDILWRGFRRVRPVSSKWLECLNPDWVRRWQIRERLHEWDRRWHRATRSEQAMARFKVEIGMLTEGFTMLTKLGHATGVAFSCPYGDEDLLELGMNLPGRYLLQDGWDRYIFRVAFADLLPPVVAWRRKKSDLSSAFCHVMHQAAASLDPTVLESMGEAVADWVLPSAWRSMVQGFLARPTPEDAVRFWQVWVLARWRMGRDDRPAASTLYGRT